MVVMSYYCIYFLLNLENFIMLLQQVEPMPTADLDRTDDKVYASTIHVVKAITTLTHDVKESQTHCYLDLVKKVGGELRELLATVDSLMADIPPSSHREVRTKFFSFRLPFMLHLVVIKIIPIIVRASCNILLHSIFFFYEFRVFSIGGE